MWAESIEGQFKRIVSGFRPQWKVWIDRGNGKADSKEEACEKWLSQRATYGISSEKSMRCNDDNDGINATDAAHGSVSRSLYSSNNMRLYFDQEFYAR